MTIDKIVYFCTIQKLRSLTNEKETQGPLYCETC
jgi:hypothetical protein